MITQMTCTVEHTYDDDTISVSKNGLLEAAHMVQGCHDGARPEKALKVIFDGKLVMFATNNSPLRPGVKPSSATHVRPDGRYDDTKRYET